MTPVISGAAATLDPVAGDSLADDKIITFDDPIGKVPAGYVFYPEALIHLREVLTELVGPQMGRPKEFNAKIELYLDLIIGRFDSVHRTHAKANAVYERYRTAGQPYGLYLRSFVLSGMRLGIRREGDQIVSKVGWAANDSRGRAMFRRAIGQNAASLSFFNVFDFYPSRIGVASRKDVVSDIPSFRVLSHNWREVVTEVIRGAKFIALIVDGKTEGVSFEVETIRHCKMADRTVVIVASEDEIDSSIYSDFHAAFHVPRYHLGTAGSTSREIRVALHALATDGFQQQHAVRDLSELECHVIDRNIEYAASQHALADLAGVPYENYVPSSLASNWNLLGQQYADMLGRWQIVEDGMKSGKWAGTEYVADTMYTALRTFHLAVTLERYREMALALAIVGMAHRAVTRRVDIMLHCYRHAELCSVWAHDQSNVDFYRRAVRSLKAEAARDK